MVKKSTVFRYKTNTIELEANGIVYFRSEADDVYTDTDLATILDIAEEANAGKPFLLLMMVNEYNFLMTKEARTLFSTYEKAKRLIKAEGVVVSSTASRILYNLLTKLHQPTFPFKAFTKEEDAVKWLLKYA